MPKSSIKWVVNLIGISILISLFINIYISNKSLKEHTFHRLESVQNVQIGAITSVMMSSDKLLQSADFWKKGVEYKSDDFFAISTTTRRSTALSPLSNRHIDLGAENLGIEPIRRIKVDYRGVKVYSVGRSVKIGYQSYDFYAETDVSDVAQYSRADTIERVGVFSMLFLLWLTLKTLIFRASNSYKEIKKNSESTNLTRLLDDNDTEFTIYYEFFKHCPLGAILVEKNGNIKCANEKLSELLGYSIKELTSMDVDALVPDDEKSGQMVGVISFLERNEIGKSSTKNVRAKCKDGSVIDIQLSISILSSFDYEGNKTVVGAGVVNNLGG